MDFRAFFHNQIQLPNIKIFSFPEGVPRLKSFSNLSVETSAQEQVFYVAVWGEDSKT